MSGGGPSLTSLVPPGPRSQAMSQKMMNMQIQIAVRSMDGLIYTSISIDPSPCAESNAVARLRLHCRICEFLCLSRVGLGVGPHIAPIGPRASRPAALAHSACQGA